MKQAVVLVMFVLLGECTSRVCNAQITPPSGGVISCIGTPGNTAANYRVMCLDSSNNVWVCKNQLGCAVSSDWSQVNGSGGNPAFSAITSGTNGGNSLVIGNGSELSVTGSGINIATQLTTVNTGLALISGVPGVDFSVVPNKTTTTTVSGAWTFSIPLAITPQSLTAMAAGGLGVDANNVLYVGTGAANQTVPLLDSLTSTTGIPLVTDGGGDNAHITPDASGAPSGTGPFCRTSACALSNPVINGLSVTGTVYQQSNFFALTDGSTITWAIGSVPVASATVTLGGNRTLNITNPVNGGSYVLKLVQDATGSRTLTLGTGCTWKVSGGGMGAITPSTGGGDIDILAFTYDGTNCYANFNKNFD